MIPVVVVLVSAAVAALLCFGIGIAQWHGFYIDHEIKPLDVATLFVNILIAVLLQYYFLSRSGNVRAEKDLIIDDIRAVIVRLRESNELFLKRMENKNSRKDDWANSVAQCRGIANALDILEFSLTSAKCGKCQPLKTKSDDLKQKFFAYKRVVTDTPVNRVIKVDVASEQAQIYRSLIKELQTVVFEINRH